jgi:hypothetical protein
MLKGENFSQVIKRGKRAHGTDSKISAGRGGH